MVANPFLDHAKAGGSWNFSASDTGQAFGGALSVLVDNWSTCSLTLVMKDFEMLLL